MQINCKIWQNTPNSLIDFESDENVSLSIQIDKKGSLYKKGAKLNLVSPFDELITKQNSTNINNGQDDPECSNSSGLFICKIFPRKDIYEIELNDLKKDEAYDIDDIPWIISRYVFENENDHGYHIHEGDLLKLGKFILKVRQIRLKKESLAKTMIDNKDKYTKYEDEDISKNILNQKSEKDLFKTSTIQKDLLLLTRLKEKSSTAKIPSYNGNQEDHENSKAQDNPTCRICLGDEHDDINPLINPCKCSGTMKYLHLSCLRQLIDSKIQKTVGECVTVLTFKTLECDICKSLIPENIKIKNKIYTIIDLNRPDNNYMIIEGIVKETPDTKSIFVINFKDSKPIKIGRASDADVRLSDISVSRAHALISIYDGNCVLIDTKSKFGTLVNAGNKLCVLPNKPLSIQKGNIFLKFSISLKLCSLLSCYKPRKLPFHNYNMFFESLQGNKCQIKDVPNFLWTDTQIVSEYEGYSANTYMKKPTDANNNAIETNGNRNCIDSRNLTGDITDIAVSHQEQF